jgi:hypothetical protein
VSLVFDICTYASGGFHMSTWKLIVVSDNVMIVG